MNSRTYKNTWLSINTFYNKTYTELINLSQQNTNGKYNDSIVDHYSAYIYDDEVQHYYRRYILGRDVEIPYFSALKLCDSISEHVFNLLYFSLNTTKDFAEGKVDQRLLSSISIKNTSKVNVSTCEESEGSRTLALDVIKRISCGEAEWGLISYFTSSDDNGRPGIFIQLIHSYFTNVFFIPVDYSAAKDLSVVIHTNAIELFSSGNDFDDEERIVRKQDVCLS